ncbi:MAG: sulfate permease [Patescibacteria group bacterium]|nr:sulfate permease [Patescibacteria group bacterium]
MATKTPITISVPILNTLKNYSRGFFRHDLIAGITVAAIAVPQAMAYAQLAGAPIAVGLYGALIAMIFFAIFTSTRLVMAGPDAALAALTGASILPLLSSNSDPTRAVALIALFSILIGIACILALIGKLGFMSEFLSRPILLGYMAGLALAVIASQAPRLFGITPVPGANFFNSILHILTNLQSASIPTVGLSLVLIALSILVLKYAKRVPLSLFLLVASIVISTVFNLKDAGVAVIGSIPSGLPLPKVPAISMLDIQALFVPAAAVMLISYANTIATARSFAAKENEIIDSDQEFFALGVSNIMSGIFGGMPAAASGARTAVAKQSHSSTQVAQLIGAVAIGLVLLFFSPLLQSLPYAALAIIIILAISKLFDIPEMKSIWHAWRTEAGLAVITMLGVTILGIFQGLLLAIILAIANMIRTSAFPNDAELGVAEDGSIRDMSRPPKTELIPGIVIYRFDAPLYFSNANFFRKRVLELVDSRKDIHWFLWDAETITSIDSTAGAMLFNLIHELKERDITFSIARMKGPIRHTINRTNRLSRIFRAIPHYSSMGDALTEFEKTADNKGSSKK